MKLENLIVSCQALPGEALYGGDTIIKIAQAVVEAGANAIRTNGGNNVISIRNMCNIPIIGLVKKDYPGYEVYITPTYEEIDELGQAQAHWIALDATKSSRPISLEKLVNYAREKYPNILLLADVSNYEEAKIAQEIGFDAIATTMVGYTSHTKGNQQPDFDLLKKIIADIDLPIIAEGNFNTPERARKALDIGASAVVVGSAITRPHYITKTYLDEIKYV